MKWVCVQNVSLGFSDYPINVFHARNIALLVKTKNSA